jgi:hypothetical protein
VVGVVAAPPPALLPTVTGEPVGAGATGCGRGGFEITETAGAGPVGCAVPSGGSGCGAGSPWTTGWCCGGGAVDVVATQAGSAASVTTKGRAKLRRGLRADIRGPYRETDRPGTSRPPGAG